MKPIHTLIAIAISLASINAVTSERLNGREAADVCKQQISINYAEEGEIQFKRNPASSLKGDAYIFWINATEKKNGDKSSMKYQCEITRSGELVSLTRAEGRWKI